MRFFKKIHIIFSKSNNLFEEVLLPIMPKELVDDINKMKMIHQNLEWHPEDLLYIHTKVVTNRLHKKYKNINLILAGVFHDLGKIDTTFFNEEKNTYSAHGHEDLSLVYIEQNIEWIKSVGGNPDKIRYIVQHHMRVKFLNEMKKSKKLRFQAEKWFHLVEKFATCDKGGF
jgi:hypothetical protein